MELLYDRMSGNSARSLFALYEAGVPFTPRRIDTRAGANQTDAYRAVNPMGR